MRVTELLVDGKTMYVCDSSSERAKIGENAPHSHYAVRRKEIHVEVSAFKSISKKIGPVGSVVELFGGSGWQGSIIQEQNKPTIHETMDISPDCVSSIQRSLPAATVQQVDSYAWAEENLHRGFSWIHADFNNLTYMKWGLPKAAAKRDGILVDKIFRYAAQWVTLTDSAIFGLARFARNREAYRSLFRPEDPSEYDFKAYFNDVADVVAKRYGFHARDAVVWNRMAGLWLFERSDVPSAWDVREHKEKIQVKQVKTWEE